ncbi:MAG: hypothetical protein OSB70_12160 [Myxococcota bacterium]|nr:hypothetical protein [Myxococcota bacterium]
MSIQQPGGCAIAKILLIDQEDSIPTESADVAGAATRPVGERSRGLGETLILGGPAREWDYTLYRALLSATTTSHDFTGEKFIAALESKPMGWLYGEAPPYPRETYERYIFTSDQGETAEAIIDALRIMVHIACSDPTTCTGANGYPLPPKDIMRNTGGYSELSLEGVWARAPYLHNGSVPTICALLSGDRLARFWRGNVTFNEADIGFTSDRPTGPKAAVYDTTLSGNSNTGHDTAEFNGLD